MQLILESPAGGFTTTPNNIPWNSFSKLCISDFNGVTQKCLTFPCNDTTYYFAEYFEILDNGKIAIGGTINPPNNSATPFIALALEDLSSFEFIKPINELNNNFMESFNVLNNSIYVSDLSKLLVYDLNGIKIGGYKFFNDTITNPFNYDNSFFTFNDKFFLSLPTNNNGTLNNYLAALDASLNINEFYNNIFINNPANLNVRVAKRGKSYNFKHYINSVLTNNIGNNYPCISKLDSTNEIEILYMDTTIQTLGNLAYNLENQLAIYDENNIYACFPIKDSLEQGLVVYSINGNGGLNWKKKVLLNDYGFFLSQCTWSTFKYAKRNNENEIVLTLDVNDAFNKKDVYITKLDFLGNPIDFSTNIFSITNDKTDFILYPNPIKDKLFLKTNLTERYIIKVYNMLGELKFEKQVKNDAEIDLELLPKGNYLYQILSNEKKGLQYGKFLKE